MAKKRKPKDPWADAIAHLREADPRMAALIDEVGPCELVPRPDRFGTLVQSIVSQQISGKAAASIGARLRALAGDPPTPEGILALSEEELRGVGRPRTKGGYA